MNPIRERLAAILKVVEKSADTNMQGALRDVLTDLRHIAAANGLDFSKAVSGSEEVYDEECPIKDFYEDGECPDCNTPIPDEASYGDECANCGHVFCRDTEADDEQQRRDEKHGLYGGLEDPAN